MDQPRAQGGPGPALRENEGYLLPVRLDDTELPSLLETTGYLRWPPENDHTIGGAAAEASTSPRALTSSLPRFVDQQPDHEKARRLADQFTRLQQQVEQRQPQPPPSPTGLPLGYFVPQPVYARFAEQLGDVKDHLQILTSASSTPPQEKLELFVMALMKSLDDQISQELARSSTAGTVHEMGKPSRVLQLITQRAAAFDLLSGLRDKEYDATARAAIQRSTSDPEG